MKKSLKQRLVATASALSMILVYPAALAKGTVTLDKYISQGEGTYAMPASDNAPFGGAYVTTKDGKPCIKMEFTKPDANHAKSINTGIQVFNLGNNTSNWKNGIIKVQTDILHEGDKSGSECVAIASLGASYGGRIYASKISNIANKDIEDENGSYYSIGDSTSNVAYVVNIPGKTESTYLNDGVINEVQSIPSDITNGCKVWFWAAFGKANDYSAYYLWNTSFVNYDSSDDVETAIEDAENSMTQVDVDVARMVVSEYAPDDKKAEYNIRIDEIQNRLYSSSVLAQLSVNGGELSPTFDSSVTDYTITVPYGTQSVPELEYRAASPKADISVYDASTLSEQTAISVTSMDGSSTTVYNISYVIAKNTDAGINEITSADGAISGEGTEYYIDVPYNTKDVPQISVVMNDENAAYDIVYPNSTDGSITVNTVADDGVTALSYKVHINVLPPFVIKNVTSNTERVTADIEKSSEYKLQYDIFTMLYKQSDGAIIPGKTDIKHYAAQTEPENPYIAELDSIAADDKIRMFTLIDEELYSKTDKFTVSADKPVADHGVDVNITAENLVGKSAYVKIKDNSEKIVYVNELPTVSGKIAEKLIIPEADIWANGIYNVRVECGNEYNETKIDVRPFSSDTLIKGITVSDAVSVPTVTVDKDTYDIVLKYGTVTIPNVLIELNDKNASFTVKKAETVPGSFTVDVTAEDKTLKKYIFNYVWSKDDAYLKELSVTGGVMSTNFIKNEYSYSAKMPSGLYSPQITAKPEDSAAEVVISTSGSVPGKAVITVTAADGITKCVYTLSFTAESSYSGGGGSGGGGGGGYKTQNIITSEPEIQEPNDTENKTDDKTDDETVFSDIASHWAKESIEFMNEKGFVTGKDGKTFEPDSKITRAEFCAILVRALGLTDGKDKYDFKDVPADSWYYDVVSKAASNNIVGGYDGTFSPNTFVTREEMAKMVSCAFAQKSDAVTEKTDDFSDTGDISDWARDAVYICKSNGFITGNTENMFMPRENATRAEATVILKRLYDAAK